VRRALALITNEPTGAKKAPIGRGPGRVEFRDISFGYTAEAMVLQDLSLVLEAGQVTALVGPSGAGKTTAVDLLLKLHTPTRGQILLDGRDIADIDTASLRRSIGVVSADGAVFRGTIAENIAYARPEATPNEIRAAAEAAGLSPAIERLPLGLASEIGEGGVGLSLGERQRVQIARALLGQPLLLVLDEATANLDYVTEADLKAGLQKLRRDRTTLVIAHRFSMVDGADRAIVLDRRTRRGERRTQRTGHWFRMVRVVCTSRCRRRSVSTTGGLAGRKACYCGLDCRQSMWQVSPGFRAQGAHAAASALPYDDVFCDRPPT
jgi:ABC-type multidrug transport system fused ATPase/permease subunit